MRTDSLIIGGGVAGLWCAHELSRLGLQVTVLEKAAALGGHVAGYSCKATDSCQRCGACLLEDVAAQVRASDAVTCLVRSDVLRVERTRDGFELSVATRPERVHPDRCTRCDACIHVCPVGAISAQGFASPVAFDEQRCLALAGGSCRACVDACPEEALHLNGQPEDVSIEARSLVLATGFTPFDPTGKPRFGYGRVPGVITAAELDLLLRNDTFTVGRGDREIRSVAFIQCVGSRDAKLGRNYCSRVCCGYAMRLARLLRSRFAGLQPAMFYMDLQTFDRDFERRIAEAACEVRLVRAIPSDVRASAHGRPELIYESAGDERVAEEFDLVVLSVGIHPNPVVAWLADQPALGLNEDGFVGGNGEDVSTTVEGVFVAGTVQGPKSIAESVSHAVSAAGQVAAFLNRSGGRT